MPPEPLDPAPQRRPIFVGTPKNLWDWIVILIGYGLPLAAFISLAMQRPSSPGIFGGYYFDLLAGRIELGAVCIVAAITGAIGIRYERPLSGWIIPFAILLFAIWRPQSLPAGPPPRPRVRVWGTHDVQYMGVLSRGRVAMCGPLGDLAIVDPAGSTSIYPAPQWRTWCRDNIRPMEEGFFAWGSGMLVWSDLHGNDHIVFLPSGTGGVSDVALLPSGKFRLVGHLTTETGDGRPPTSVARITDVALDGSSQVIAQIPQPTPEVLWEGGVLFQDGSAALYSNRIYWLSPAGVLGRRGEIVCYPKAVPSLDHLFAFFFGERPCGEGDLSRMDSGRLTAMRLTPPRPRLDPIFRIADAGNAGFFVVGQSGVTHYDTDGHMLTSYLDFPDQIFWDGSALITLKQGVPRRQFPDGTMDAKFRWPTIETIVTPFTDEHTSTIR